MQTVLEQKGALILGVTTLPSGRRFHVIQDLAISNRQILTGLTDAQAISQFAGESVSTNNNDKLIAGIRDDIRSRLGGKNVPTARKVSLWLKQFGVEKVHIAIDGHCKYWLDNES